MVDTCDILNDMPKDPAVIRSCPKRQRLKKRGGRWS